MIESIYMPYDDLIAAGQQIVALYGYDAIAALYHARGYRRLSDPGPERWRSVLRGVEYDARQARGLPVTEV